MSDRSNVCTDMLDRSNVATDMLDRSNVGTGMLDRSDVGTEMLQITRGEVRTVLVREVRVCLIMSAKVMRRRTTAHRNVWDGLTIG